MLFQHDLTFCGAIRGTRVWLSLLGTCNRWKKPIPGCPWVIFYCEHLWQPLISGISNSKKTRPGEDCIIHPPSFGHLFGVCNLVVIIELKALSIALKLSRVPSTPNACGSISASTNTAVSEADGNAKVLQNKHSVQWRSFWVKRPTS